MMSQLNPLKHIWKIPQKIHKHLGFILRNQKIGLPSGKLYNMAMENGPNLKMYSLLKMVIFHCHVIFR